jgi:hypothetical protein
LDEDLWRKDAFLCRVVYEGHLEKKAYAALLNLGQSEENLGVRNVVMYPKKLPAAGVRHDSAATAGGVRCDSTNGRGACASVEPSKAMAY